MIIDVMISHEFDPEALDEYEEAVLYFEERRGGLGARFIMAVETPAGTKVSLGKAGPRPCLHELLLELRRGYILHRPILLDEARAFIFTSDDADPLGVTTVSTGARVSLLGDLEYWIMAFAAHPFLVLGENSLAEDPMAQLGE